MRVFLGCQITLRVHSRNVDVCHPRFSLAKWSSIMVRHSLIGMLSGILVLPASLLHADEPKPLNEKALPPTTDMALRVEAPVAVGCASCGGSISRTIVTLVEEQTATTRPKLELREQVQFQVVPALEVEYREERRKVTEMVLKPRECEQVVTVHKLKELTTTDPVTGKPCTHYESVPETRTFKVTVYVTVPEQREVIVRVPCLKTVEKAVLVKKLCAYPTTEAVIEKRLRAEPITNDLAVPICPTPVGCLPKN